MGKQRSQRSEMQRGTKAALNEEPVIGPSNRPCIARPGSWAFMAAAT